ncbi:MAG: putative RNA-dependent RNA polymerase [Enontekio merhavirus]|nr:MAG: putative RNA-dependent RNA polymerase [Enontekio merhavirus]
MDQFMESEVQDYDDLVGESEHPYDAGEGDYGFEFDEVAAVADHFVTKDYTLDSPLLAGEIDAFIDDWNGMEYEEISKKRNWSNRRAWLSKNGVSRATVNGSREFHKWCGRLNQMMPNLSAFRTFLEQVDHDARTTFKYVEAFFVGWIGDRIDFADRSGMDERTVRCGALYYLLYQVVLFLNSSSEYETLNLLGTFGGSVTPGLEVTAVKLIDPALGTILVGYDYVWFSYGDQLLDRPMALMVKDMLGGRFQAMMHVQFREFPSYEPDHLDKLWEVLREGDNLLQLYGNMSYAAIKKVEGLALERIHQLSSEMKPRLPTLSRFRMHLEKSCVEQEESLPGSLHFSNLILGQANIQVLLTIYGSFRLWGHPFIDYFAGLLEFHTIVHLEKDIDTEYARKLGSDLAFKVLHTQFQRHRRWFVDKLLVPESCILYPYIQSNTWPPAGVIDRFGDHWEGLPLTKCFDVPETLPASVMYADKYHAASLSEIKDHIREQRPGPLPSRSVLESYLSREATNVKEFVERVDREGLSEEALVILLRAKEREQRIAGRFFAMMGWDLREYFVITEYLIGEFYAPLFRGLTMTDGYNTVSEKMMEATRGQNVEDYRVISVANHLDFSKWNQHQRHEANYPSFKVMGQFLGYPRLFTRTHEFFKECMVLYKDRPDLMMIDGDRILNRTEKVVCWKGQAGGCEGLRQKGWCVVGCLSNERESQVRNTAVKLLAQGDNQVITTVYRVRDCWDNAELDKAITEAFRNNQCIFENIVRGSSKLGLIINEDETLQSAAILVYGKIIMIHGLFQGLPEKVFARVLCGTNDQLPTLGSVLGTVVTAALSVAHLSNSPTNSIIQYNWLGNLVLNMVSLHDPAIKGPLDKILNQKTPEGRDQFRVYFLFLDPSLGGIGGLSLTRFLLRQFPDPVTEGLSFWKVIADQNVSAQVTRNAVAAGHPKIATYVTRDLERLIENPAGLNLPRGAHITSILRSRIRQEMITNRDTIPNEVVTSALNYIVSDETKFLNFLGTINPLFPRFISEFFNATFAGVSRDIVGLFENSRTIRRHLQPRLGEDVDKIIIRSELSSIAALTTMRECPDSAWECSSTQADNLREESWGRKTVGTTVPHPLELCGDVVLYSSYCTACESGGLCSDCITVIAPYAFPTGTYQSGPYAPYIGSTTSEATSLIQPWAKIPKVPLVKRAFEMRRAITWMVEPGSNIAQAIHNNIAAQTGEDSSVMSTGFRRTGSALHRFSCSRVPSGGYSAVSPNHARFLLITTDTLKQMGAVNTDMIYQSCISFAQTTIATKHMNSPAGAVYHLHIKCQACVRPIEEPILETPLQHEFPDVTSILCKMKVEGTPWYEERPVMDLRPGDWDAVTDAEKSYHVGRMLGFYFTDRRDIRGTNTSDLFPLTLRNHLHPWKFLEGVVDGIYRGCAISMLHRASAAIGRDHWSAIEGSFEASANSLSLDAPFQTLMQGTQFVSALHSGPHKMPASYPVTSSEQGDAIRSFLCHLFMRRYRFGDGYYPPYPNMWIFADFLVVDVAGPLLLSSRVCSIFSKRTIDQVSKNALYEYSNLNSNLRGLEQTLEMINSIVTPGVVFLCRAEVRFACKDIIPPVHRNLADVAAFGREWTGMCRQMELNYHSVPTEQINKVQCPNIRDPTIAGLRLTQLATGSYLKLRTILPLVHPSPRDFLCIGDESGGKIRQFFINMFSGLAVMDIY